MLYRVLRGSRSPTGRPVRRAKSRVGARRPRPPRARRVAVAPLPYALTRFRERRSFRVISRVSILYICTGGADSDVFCTFHSVRSYARRLYIMYVIIISFSLYYIILLLYITSA